MQEDGLSRSLAALRRKLRALGAVARDPGATAPERANAAALKQRIEERLRRAGAPQGDWSDQAFRLGRWAKKTAAGRVPDEAAVTDTARRLGKAFGRGYKKWFSG